MSSLIFFSPNTVLSDIEQKAETIQSNYNVDRCQMYNAEEDGTRWLGYYIEKDRKFFVVKMQYAENETGELAIKNKKWIVAEIGKAIGSDEQSQGERNLVHETDKVIASELPSLGEAFTLLGVSKR